MDLKDMEEAKEAMRLALIHHENHACPTFTEAHNTYTALVFAIDEITRLRTALRELVEAAKEIDPAIDRFNNARGDISLAKKVAAFNALFNASDKLKAAIAAAEGEG
jgi:hypothetical protein